MLLIFMHSRAKFGQWGLLLHYVWDGVEIGFHYTFQNLRDEVSVCGTHESSVISSHILQSAFLAEERKYPGEDNWQRRNLSTRAKNILKLLQEKDVTHAILKGHRAYSKPGQDARISLEARRLIRHTDSLREGTFTVIPVAVVCSCLLFLGVLLSMLSAANRPLFYFCYEHVLRFFSNDQVRIAVICVSGCIIVVVCLGLLIAFCVLKKHPWWHLLSRVMPYRKHIIGCYVCCVSVLCVLMFLYTYLGIVSERESLTSDLCNSTGTIEITTQIKAFVRCLRKHLVNIPYR